MRSFLGIAVFLAFAAQLAAVETPWSMSRVDLEVDLDPARGRATIRGRATFVLGGESANSGPILGINRRNPITHFERVEVISPDRPHAPVEPRRLEDSDLEVAAIEFDEPLAPGSTVTVAYTLSSSERSIQYAVTPGFALGSWVEYWYPVARGEEDRYGSSTAPGTTTIRMPAEWRGVAAGSLIDAREEGGARVETWVADAPMARSFAAGPLTRVEVDADDGVAVSFFVLDPSKTYADRAAVLGRAIEAMEHRFGPYPYPSWNVVEIPEEVIGFGAASEQGFIMVRSSVLANESGALPLFAHEAGHAWWGNRMRAVGPGGRMIGEALAQYGAVIAIEALEGRDAAIEFLRFSRSGYNPVQSALGYFYLARLGKDEPLAVLAGEEGHNLADSKGMWFHHMLRERLGDERYFAVLRALFTRFDGGAATLDDFRALVVAGAPDDPGIESYLGQWLERTGAPELGLTWWSIDRGKGVHLTIEQTQIGEPYALDLDLEIGLHDGTTTFERVRIGERSQTFELPVPARPLEVRLDPKHRILLWRPEYGPPLSLLAAEGGRATIAIPATP